MDVEICSELGFNPMLLELSTGECAYFIFLPTAIFLLTSLLHYSVNLLFLFLVEKFSLIALVCFFVSIFIVFNICYNVL